MRRKFVYGLFVLVATAILLGVTASTISAKPAVHARALGTCGASALTPIVTQGYALARGNIGCSSYYQEYICLQRYFLGWSDYQCSPTYTRNYDFSPTLNVYCPVFTTVRTRLWTGFTGSLYSGSTVC
jgi:hypothetical protein